MTTQACQEVWPPHPLQPGRRCYWRGRPPPGAATPIDGFGILQESIGAHLGEEVTITLERAGTQQVVTLVPRQTPPHGEGPIGVTLGNPTQPVGWTEAFSIGAQTTVTQFGEILRLPRRLINGELTPAGGRGGRG